MKYGQTLQQRSIPEWAAYNVDYNEIKHLIKCRTTRSHGQAISIPGQGHEGRASAEFEEELYAELSDQHQRIDLFVRSKTGETERRLQYLLKQILRLTKQVQPTNKKPISLRRLENFAKVESEVLKAGEEIQSLAQFVAAQRLAFRKLLKKYRKWTGSESLETRFKSEILSKQSNFSQKDFGPLLEQWSGVLAAVRAPFEAGLSWKPTTKDRTPSASPDAALVKSVNGSRPKTSSFTASDRATTTTVDLFAIHSTGSDIDVDTEFATGPLGDAASRAVYWVHSDDLIQLHILLLQHTRIRRPPESRLASTISSPGTSRRTSVQSSTTGRAAGMQDEVGLILCDNLKSFAERRTGATIDELEKASGTLLDSAAVSIRYSSGDEATVAINSLPTHHYEDSTGGSTNIFKTKMRRKKLSQLLDLDGMAVSSPSSRETISESENILNCRDNGTEIVKHWLANHRDINPLVHLNFQRTRFVGLSNNNAKGVWAMLDKSISMKKWSIEDMRDLNCSTTTTDPISQNFPHAILEIRWIGLDQPDLINQLDETHLTERVRGFSLSSHAITTLCKPPGMLPPSWLPVLSRDIRKVPARPFPSRRQSAAMQRSSNEETSTSTTSVADGPSGSDFSAMLSLESPATSAAEQLNIPPKRSLKKKHPARNFHPLARQLSASTARPERYWNEFDDGDEAPAEEAYTVIVDPDASSFLGVASLSHFLTTISSTAKASSEKVKAWLLPASRTKPPERQPLIDDYFTPRPATEDADLDSDSSSAENVPCPHRYSTFPPLRSSTLPRAEANRDSLLARGCLGSFCASISLLVIAAVLVNTARRRYIRTADVGTLVGVVSSLVFAAAGMGMMVARKGNGGWAARSAVFALFAMLCAENAVLLLVVVRG
ncbi:hypothetical protein MMC13_003969 [Lambiella insularis]|nr:hypothetical protein [Lambiella insularis]